MDLERFERIQQAVLLLLGVLLLRMTELQLLHGAHYRQLAEQNRMRLVPDAAPRGLLVDRAGVVLADNQSVFRIALVPQDVEDAPRLLTQVGGVVGRTPQQLRHTFNQTRSLAFLPATIVPSVPKETALRLEEARWDLPGLFVRAETIRRYPSGLSAAHLLGYLNEPTPEELPLLKTYGVRPKQPVGRAGVERLLESELRGRSGGMLIEVNNRNRQVGVLGRRPPEPGAKVTLTIDAGLQSLLLQTFGPQPGAAVVLNPADGAVLALVSTPSFPPEAFAAADTQTVLQLLDDPNAPMMNRATMGQYLPGSIMKIVTAAAALEQHVITPETTITCGGSITIGDRTFHCWNRDGHGPLTVTQALMQSCNVFFMQVGRRLGATRLRAALERAGYGHRTGWPLDELAGHLPQRHLSEGEVCLLAIGQGELLVTVMQAAIVAGAVANGGTLVTPWVVHAIADHPGPHPPPMRSTGWSARTIEIIRAGMQAVVLSEEGTGHRAASSIVSIAAKTGTAQTQVPDRPHGWFTGYCPVEHPRAAFAIVAEHGGSGGDLPAEIGRTLCEYVATMEPVS